MTRRRRTKLQRRLMHAVMFGDLRHVSNALRAGADANQPSAGLGSDGLPLCAAACWGQTDTVRELLAAGADPDAREDDGAGSTASEWAARGGWSATLAVLRAAGAR